MSLHNEIMNLPMPEAYKVKDNQSDIIEGYQFGHRDARHAAAELAATREAELIEALKELLEEYDMQRSQFGDDYIWEKYERVAVIAKARELVK